MLNPSLKFPTSRRPSSLQFGLCVCDVRGWRRHEAEPTRCSPGPVKPPLSRLVPRAGAVLPKNSKFIFGVTNRLGKVQSPSIALAPSTTGGCRKPVLGVWGKSSPRFSLSRFGLVVRRWTGKQTPDLFVGSSPLRLSFRFSSCDYGHCLVTLALTMNETLKWRTPLSMLMRITQVAG